jgi:hypothetical protein
MPKRSQRTTVALRRKTDEAIKTCRAKDSARLDWLLDNLCDNEVRVGGLSWNVYTREDIDAAMRQCESPISSEEKPRAE